MNPRGQRTTSWELWGATFFGSCRVRCNGRPSNNSKQPTGRVDIPLAVQMAATIPTRQSYSVTIMYCCTPPFLPYGPGLAAIWWTRSTSQEHETRTLFILEEPNMLPRSQLPNSVHGV